ncbi:hypothetical protein ACWGKX_04630, partial [Streptomyces tricolor]
AGCRPAGCRGPRCDWPPARGTAGADVGLALATDDPHAEGRGPPGPHRHQVDPRRGLALDDFAALTAWATSLD